MIGLIKKDFISLTKKIKLVNRLIITFVIIALLISLKSAGVIAICIFLPLLMVSFPTTLINEDDKFKWDRYALALPVSKKEIVAGRYLFCILLLSGCFIFNIITGTVVFFILHEYSISQLFLIAYIGIWIALMYILLILPSLYKFGINGGQIIMVVLFVISSISAFIVKKGYFSFQQVLKLPILPCVIISIGMFSIIGICSYLISLKIYENNHS